VITVTVSNSGVSVDLPGVCVVFCFLGLGSPLSATGSSSSAFRLLVSFETRPDLVVVAVSAVGGSEIKSIRGHSLETINLHLPCASDEFNPSM